MYKGYRELQIGDVIELDKTIYTYGVDASGSLVMLGQHGNIYEDDIAFEESLADQIDLPQAQQSFFYSAHPLPEHKIGKNGADLIGKTFVIVSAYADGVPEEHHDDLMVGDDVIKQGYGYIADEMLINEHDENYLEGDAVRLRVSFYKGKVLIIWLIFLK